MVRSHMREAAPGLLLIFAFLGSSAIGGEPSGHYGLGHLARPGEIAAWDIDVRADGSGLPKGHGSTSEGREIFISTCAACHGDKGEGIGKEPNQLGPPLVGGKGTLRDAEPLKTVGSFWPYATTLYDYIHRAMPFNAPQSLTPDQVYALSAYVLNLNGLFPENGILDARKLSAIVLPNRNGFTSDPRPDILPPKP
jgi:mono/diheme cytochrome c family protein